MEHARRMHAPRAMALCQCFNGALEFQAGRWDEAEAALHDSIRLHREIGALSGEALACQRLGTLLTARGQLEDGMNVIVDGIAAAERAIMRAHCLTRLYVAMARNRLAANDLDAAGIALAQGLEMSERHGHCTTCNALLLPVGTSVSIARGEIEAAEAFSRELDAEAESYGSSVWLAMARQTHGELELALGDFEAAIGHFQAAYDGFHQANYLYEAARCQMFLGDVYHHIHDPQRGQAAGTLASQIFSQLGVR